MISELKENTAAVKKIGMSRETRLENTALQHLLQLFDELHPETDESTGQCSNCETVLRGSGAGLIENGRDLRLPLLNCAVHCTPDVALA